MKEGSVVEPKEEEILDAERLNVWPMDLEPNSQIIFRPLFVYKQKKAEQHEEHRRKAEANAYTSTEGNRNTAGNTAQHTVTYLQPPSEQYIPYYPYYYYYQYQHQYPTPHYHYAHYPYSLYSYYQNRG